MSCVEVVAISIKEESTSTGALLSFGEL